MFDWLLTVPLAVVRWLLTPVPLTLLALLFALLYYFITKDFDFWKSRGVPGPEPRFPWGNESGPPFWTPMTEFERWLYYKHGGKKFCGFFELNRPVLFVGDPDLIRAIAIKDFEYFTDRRDQGADETMKEAVSILRGAEWKETRSVMSPTFSASKLKAMHQLTLDNAQNLTKYVLEDMEKKGEVEMKDMFGRFTMDNIASCAFGVNCNSFTDPNSQFATNAAKIFNLSLAGLARFLASGILPASVMKLLPDPGAKTTSFFADVVNKTIAHREKHPSSTRDFLQLLMDTKDKEGKRILSDSSIVAQSVIFFIAGYDTTASLLTFAAYCLSQDQEIQQRVQKEVDEALTRHGGLTYEAVMDMPYLDRVISESLRMYPVATRLERLSTKEYTLPGTNVHIPPGTVVQMSVFMLHNDPDYYPNPSRFDPDRFLPEEKERRHPCAYIPFGVGPRNCIAMRFALFEAKVALVSMMSKMTLKPTPKTPPHPMPLNKMAFLLSPEGGKLPLMIVQRNKNE